MSIETKTHVKCDSCLEVEMELINSNPVLVALALASQGWYADEDGVYCPECIRVKGEEEEEDDEEEDEEEEFDDDEVRKTYCSSCEKDTEEYHDNKHKAYRCCACRKIKSRTK